MRALASLAARQRRNPDHLPPEPDQLGATATALGLTGTEQDSCCPDSAPGKDSGASKTEASSIQHQLHPERTRTLRHRQTDDRRSRTRLTDAPRHPSRCGWPEHLTGMSNDEPQNRRNDGTDGRSRPSGAKPNPAALPVSHPVVVTVSDPGTLTDDGRRPAFPPTDPAPPWTRATLGRLLDADRRRSADPGPARGPRVRRHHLHRHHLHPPRHHRPLTTGTRNAGRHENRPGIQGTRNGEGQTPRSWSRSTGTGFLAGEEVPLAVVVAVSGRPGRRSRSWLGSAVLCGAHKDRRVRSNSPATPLCHEVSRERRPPSDRPGAR